MDFGGGNMCKGTLLVLGVGRTLGEISASGRLGRSKKSVFPDSKEERGLKTRRRLDS